MTHLLIRFICIASSCSKNDIAPLLASVAGPICIMELPHIGQNCVVCNRNDYLPFKCSHCGRIVCIDHKIRHGSDCPLAKDAFVFRTSSDAPPESLKEACDFCKKITLKLELIKCDHCNQNNCLYHRHQVNHNCKQLQKAKERQQYESDERRRQQQQAIDRLKEGLMTKSESKKIEFTDAHSTNVLPVDSKKQALARRVRVMKLKSTACGPPNILDQDKLFFEVMFLHEPNSRLSDPAKHGSKLAVFTTAKYTIGHMVDWSSSQLGLTNQNHIDNCDQLTFKVAGKDFYLDNRTLLSQYLNANELASGDQLLLIYTHNSQL